MLGFGQNNPALRAIIGAALIAVGVERQAILMVLGGIVALVLAGISLMTDRRFGRVRGGRNTDWDQR
jgi:hypothetical protein